jgi:hypothetical protein
MLRLLPFIFILGITVYALIDCLRTPDAEVRNLPKLVWAAFIVIFWLLGAVAWLLFGRPRGGGSGRTVGLPGPRPRPRPVAPDDDPDFLRRLQEQRLLEERRRQREAQPPADEPPTPPVGS